MGFRADDLPSGTDYIAYNEQKNSFTDLVLVDDLIRQLSQGEEEVPLVAYPASERGVTDYEHFTAKSIDSFITNAAVRLTNQGLDSISAEDCGEDDSPIIGLLGPSNFDYLITMLALSRLGYAVLILSPRLAIAAYESLLEETQCSLLVCSSHLGSVVDEIGKRRPSNSLHIVPRSEYERNPTSTSMCPIRPVDASLGKKPAYIMHSSGSTGLPKCIYLSHASCLSNFANGHPLKALLTVPLYHMYGHASLFRAFYQRKTCYLYNASLPVTSSNLTAAIEAVRPGVLMCVPYGLKLIAENRKGIDALMKCKVVAFAGSGCPDELGDFLTNEGIKLVGGYGTTESGLVMSSNRPDDDTAWNYLRVIPPAKPYVWMKPIENGTYELVVLDGLKSKIASNSDEPPDSYHTRDIFVPHVNIPDAWKYLGRLDDRITLVNGEKVLPLPIEGRIRQHALVREAVVFGVSRSMPGLLVFRSDAGAYMSDEEFIQSIWPAVEDANSKAESFSQISKETIIPMSATVDYPRTDKGTIIREQVFRIFDAEISEMYRNQETTTRGALKFDVDGMEAWLLQIFREPLRIQIANAQADFFAAGFDSLQATRLVHIIRKELYLNGRYNEISTSALYQTQNIEGMAKFLHHLQTGIPPADHGLPDSSEMAAMIEKYSSFSPHTHSRILITTREAIILTGVTGSLGAWVLSKILFLPSPPQIYCLVRAHSARHARDRIMDSLQTRQISHTPDQLNHITALPSDLSLPSLGLASNVLEQLRGSMTHIIHMAWPVNFMLPLLAFEKHVAGTHNLIELALSVRRPKPAMFVFCSSVSVAGTRLAVPEDYIQDLEAAQPMGYACSKLVAERVVQNAAERAGARAAVARIGQIVGDTINGVWNDTEAIPLMIRSALSTNALPALVEKCVWLPVDTVAAIVMKISQLQEGNDVYDAQMNQDDRSGVYNISNPRSFFWTQDLLPALRKAKLQFDTVPTPEWLERLKRSEQDTVKNPAIKLLGFWSEKYGRSDGEKGGTGEKGVVDTTKTREECPLLSDVPDLIGEGYVEKFLGNWLKKWKSG